MIDTLAAIHRVDWTARPSGCRTLRGGAGSTLADEVAWWRRFLEWAAGRRSPHPRFVAMLDWCASTCPTPTDCPRRWSGATPGSRTSSSTRTATVPRRPGLGAGHHRAGRDGPRLVPRPRTGAAPDDRRHDRARLPGRRRGGRRLLGGPRTPGRGPRRGTRSSPWPARSASTSARPPSRPRPGSLPAARGRDEPAARPSSRAGSSGVLIRARAARTCTRVPDARPGSRCAARRRARRRSRW